MSGTTGLPMWESGAFPGKPQFMVLNGTHLPFLGSHATGCRPAGSIQAVPLVHQLGASCLGSAPPR
jgi:hypothetical protein